ncbi:Bacterial transcription activator, effector binding domain [compost metagenome]
MNYSKDIERSIEYIEQNIKENLTAEEIAAEAGYSLYHFSRVTDEMITVDVPEAGYAVFTTPPVDTSEGKAQEEFVQTIKSTWKYIFEEWFPGSGYVYDEGKLNFEFYDERCHSRVDTVMEIYVPVRGAGK